MTRYLRPNRDKTFGPGVSMDRTASSSKIPMAEGARTMASPVCRIIHISSVSKVLTSVPEAQNFTCSLTTLSNASLPVKSAETCLIKCSHHDGDEKRCSIVTVHRSRRTGGTTVGSTEAQVNLGKREIGLRTLGTDDHPHGQMPLLPRQSQKGVGEP